MKFQVWSFIITLMTVFLISSAIYVGSHPEVLDGSTPAYRRQLP